MKKAFVSFRSTPYNDLLKNGCKMILGESCDANKALKCPYTDCSYRKAVVFSNYQKYIDCYIIPPKYILPPNTLLTAFNYFEYLPDIKNIIESSDYFIRFDIQTDSFWTEMELNFWKSHCRKTGANTIFEVSSEGKVSETEFSPMDKSEATFYWRLMYYTRKDTYGDHAWGKFANTFIQKCPTCGKTLLISTEALRYMLRNEMTLVCPHCKANKFTYYKNSIGLCSFKYTGGNDITHEPIPTEYITDLLLKSKKSLLAQTPLLCMSNESFPEQIPFIVMFTSIKDWVKKSIVGGHPEIRVCVDNDIRHLKLELK